VLRLRKNAKRLGCPRYWPRVSIRWPRGWAPIALSVGDGFIILLGTLTGHQPTNTPGVDSSSSVPLLPCVPRSRSQRFLRWMNRSAHAILGYKGQVIGHEYTAELQAGLMVSWYAYCAPLPGAESGWCLRGMPPLLGAAVGTASSVSWVSVRGTILGLRFAINSCDDACRRYVWRRQDLALPG
jgi:hypothetical protein